MHPFTLAVAAVTCSLVGGDVPSLFRADTVSPLTLAQAVNHYVSLGETDAIKELNALASDSRSDVAREIRIRERIGWVCRILYQPRGRELLRAPMYGALCLPFKTMPLETWPLYPIAVSGSTYFVLSEGYTLRGLPEEPEEYLAYCRRKGGFRKDPITIPTREQAQNDATRLRDSAGWKAIKWEDAGVGFRYTIPEIVVWEFIKGQAEAIPAK